MAGTSSSSLCAAENLPAPAPIRYTLSFPRPQGHYAHVRAAVPTDGQDVVDLFMAIWTPGSYLVREYARHVEDLRAETSDGRSLAVAKTRKNRWRIETGGAAEVVVSYQVYCREPAVQTNYVDDTFAMLNGAPTFITLVGSPKRTHEVTVELPPGWLATYTGLPEAGDGPHRYRAPDFDTLVDCPLYAGNAEVHDFEVDGKPHQLVIEGGGGIWDGPRSAKDVESIVREQAKFWGGLPYDKYVFFNILTETGGGLEHANSTLLMGSRWSTRTRPAYLGWLFLANHEFFHTWNVKRLRPVELGPFDYENEVHSKSLWVAEGLTSYYERLLVRRAGLCTTEEFLAGDPPRRGRTNPEHEIEELQKTPGRLAQPLETSSYDAWIKFYRRDENTANTSISYYTKGAVVGFLLDARIRETTMGAKNLDDLMRLAYTRFSGDKGFTPEEFRAAAAEVAGVDLVSFFDKALLTADELEYAPALNWFGLRFAAPKPPKDGVVKAWLGIETKSQSGQLMVEVVRRGTPGYDAGFNVGDEILAIGDDRVTAELWGQRMEHYRPNEQASVLISRRGRLRRLDAVFGTEPPREWSLEIDPDAPKEAQEHRRAWLNEPEPAAALPSS